jgi:hypothetical protein
MVTKGQYSSTSYYQTFWYFLEYGEVLHLFGKPQNYIEVEPIIIDKPFVNQVNKN